MSDWNGPAAAAPAEPDPHLVAAVGRLAAAVDRLEQAAGIARDHGAAALSAAQDEAAALRQAQDHVAIRLDAALARLRAVLGS